MTRPPDVWHWTVEDVTDFLRGDAVQYIRRDVPHASFPSLEQLATKLIENGVDGVTLLTAVDLPFLRDECGIKALGERTAYLRCIRHLQDSSSRYSTKDETIQWPTPDSIAQPVHLNEHKTTPVAYATVASVIGEGPRDGEQHVYDGRGRKRRRLDSSAIVTDHNAALDHHITSLDDGTDDPAGYLPEKSYSIDGLFFGNTVLGAAVGVLPPRHALFINDGEDEESDDFQYVNPRVQSGLAQYAHGCTKHFLHAPEEANVTRNAHDALVVYPYRGRMNAGKALAGSKSDRNGRLMPDSAHSAFVVQYALDTTSAALLNDEERVFITRETDAMITSNAIDLGYSVEDAAQIGGEYDHLLMKYRHRDGDVDITAFPDADDDATTIGTDDGADPDDEGGDDLAEVDDESQAGQIDIAEIIDSAVKTYQHEWRESKLPVLVKKEAWTVWKKMKRSRTFRDELVRGAQRVIEQLDNRLTKYRNYLSTMQWDGEASLRRQCEMLEPTAHDREKELWKISIWSASHAPARPSRSSVKPAYAPGTTVQQPSANGATLQYALNLLGPGDRMQFSPQRDVNMVSQTVAEEFVASVRADDERSTTAEPDEPLTTAGGEDFVMPDEAFEDDQEQVDDVMMPDEPREDDEQHEDFIADSEYALRSDTLNHGVDMVEQPTEGADDVLMSEPRSTSPQPVHDEIDESSDPPRSFRHARSTQSALPNGSSLSQEVIKEEIPDDTRPPRIKDSHAPRTPVKSKPDVVDLTVSTDSSASKTIHRRKAAAILKPERKPNGASSKGSSSRDSKPAPVENPSLATASEVDEWDFEQLAETQQRKHLLIKMLKEAGQPVQNMLWQTWQELAKAGFKRRLITAILHVNDNEGLHEVMEAQIVEAMQQCARMACAWYRSVSPRVACDPDVIQQLLNQDDQIDLFVVELRPLLQMRTSKLFMHHKSATRLNPHNVDSDEDLQDEADDVDDADEEEVADTPSSRHGSAKKRRKVKRDEVARSRRTDARARDQRFSQMQSQYSSNPDMLSQMIAADPTQSGLEINPLRKDGDPPIFINQRISQSLKPYQHEGIRFLWREVTASDSAGSQGAVLAHTMGLGKTMQTIALLTAIDEASQSPYAK
ncbi:DNA repair and recombination protein RAD54-like, partial [Oleoguttula sp. CCFEE 5521]